jgi:hypothetical protein
MRTSLIASRRNSGGYGGLVRGTSHLLAVVFRRKPSGVLETGGTPLCSDAALLRASTIGAGCHATTAASGRPLLKGAAARRHRSSSSRASITRVATLAPARRGKAGAGPCVWRMGGAQRRTGRRALSLPRGYPEPGAVAGCVWSDGLRLGVTRRHCRKFVGGAAWGALGSVYRLRVVDRMSVAWL